ncbi:MAG: ribosome assembly cofactor RimP [Muribaculaceae bacterium]|nr:ribosome assembly cofactor RimP [Muribaculaceae bacterium]MBR6432193.1 ribosome assembly cofactor RimP [Muribaculaceae bacterium]
MIDKKELITVVEKALEGTKMFLVDITVSHDNIIDVQLDSIDSITIDDCISVNNAVHEAFDQDIEDYELTVGSYSLTEPFKVLKQYEKNLGGEVEVLTRDGKKLKGTLYIANAEEFTITVPTKTKIEGKKRPEMVDVEHTFKYDEIKYTKNILQF